MIVCYIEFVLKNYSEWGRVKMTEKTVNNLTADEKADVMEKVMEVATPPTAPPSFELTVDANGKYKRKALYKAFSSVVAETREQKINLMNLLDSDDIALPMSEYTGATIKVSNVITKPYDSVDEDTGEITSGVLTYLLTPDGLAYVTSSKSVYFTLQTAMTVFGEAPYSSGDELIVEIVKKQGKQFKYTDIKVVG